MRPVPRGYYSMESLLSGLITLYDVRLANDHINVISENIRRANSK